MLFPASHGGCALRSVPAWQVPLFRLFMARSVFACTFRGNPCLPHDLGRPLPSVGRRLHPVRFHAFYGVHHNSFRFWWRKTVIGCFTAAKTSPTIPTSYHPTTLRHKNDEPTTSNNCPLASQLSCVVCSPDSGDCSSTVVALFERRLSSTIHVATSS